MLKGTSAKIYLKEEAQPHAFKPRPTSYFLRDKVEKELQRLQDQGIIQPVQFSEWAAPIVPVIKTDGSIRMCGDYKVTINQEAKLDTYPIPRIDDLFADLAGGKIFSKLDLTSAYQQVPLDPASRKFTTINTFKGLFEYTRLPFGIASTPSIFQRVMEDLLRGIPKVSIYLDDVLVAGVDKQDHLQTLDKAFSETRSSWTHTETVQMFVCSWGTSLTAVGCIRRQIKSGLYRMLPHLATFQN